MSGYEEEHNISRTAAPPPRPTHRLDFSSFFSTLRQLDDTSAPRNNAHAVPYPAEVAALYRQLANGFQVLQGETEGVAFADDANASASANTNTTTTALPTTTTTNNPLLAELIETLMQNAEAPPREIHGMPDSFFDELERVPRGTLGKDDSCPICSSPFLEDRFPLVVRLPCHREHMFDLECIMPWLKLNTTCPLDRVDLERKKGGKGAGEKKVVVEEDDEDDDDEMGMYA